MKNLQLEELHVMEATCVRCDSFAADLMSAK